MGNVYLLGFMGTGKTAVGKVLSEQLKYPFVDLDELIVRKEGMEITDIFSCKGEGYFRDLETGILREICGRDRQVVSCGGGIVLRGENLKLMKASGKLVCLAATPEIILQRTRNFRHRPLLNVPDPKAKILQLLQQRAPYYAQSDFAVDTSALAVEEVVQKILGFLAQ